MQPPHPPQPRADERILEVRGLKTHFFLNQGVVKAVDGVDLDLYGGQTLGIVGESGCGKSVTAQSIMRIFPEPPGRIVAGSITYRGNGAAVDITGQRWNSKTLRDIRGAEISYIFQEPMSALSPVHTIGRQITETILLHNDIDKDEAWRRGVELLEHVRIPRPTEVMRSYVHQLSGGMRQRAMIAQALSCRPKVLIADEPTTALDVTMQAQILRLIGDMQRELGMAVILITHDMGVIAQTADHVLVVYLGKVVESGTALRVFAEPQHPYTQALFASIPRMDRDDPPRAISGSVPGSFARITGCAFANRCPHAMDVCRTDPPLVATGDGHEVRCHLYTEGGAEAASVPAAAAAAAAATAAAVADSAVGVGSALAADTAGESDRAAATPDPTAAHDPAARAAPVTSDPPPTSDSEVAGLASTSYAALTPILEVRDLRKHFPVGGGFLRGRAGTVRAVDGVSFTIGRGETFGLVGESGCGKTTVGRTLLRAHEPTAGEMRFRPRANEAYDLARLDGAELRALRPDLQMIFQDPYASLSPRMTVKQIVGEPLVIHGLARGAALEDRIKTVLREVGMDPGHLDRYPHAFSGGQRQRIGLARALIMNPSFIVADEPVSALDVSVQAQILELFVRLKQQHGLSYLFISHDLSVVRYICDRVAVMYVGKIVELAPSRALFDSPLHPYTRALIAAVPVPDPQRRAEPELLEGDVADAANPPRGCLFHPRCPFAEDRCRQEEPLLRNLGDASTPHLVACHRAEDVQLA